MAADLGFPPRQCIGVPFLQGTMQMDTLIDNCVQEAGRLHAQNTESQRSSKRGLVENRRC
jgi:hypothetical protein